MNALATEPLALLAAYGASGVFGIVLAARLGAPVPAAPIVMLVGALALRGTDDAVALLLAAVLGNLIGDGVWFLVGRRFGYRVLRLLCRVSLSPDVCVSQSEHLIDRWGGSAIVAGKFLPGISVVAAPMAGAVGMPGLRFLSWDIVASIAWSVLYLGIGAALGEHVQRAIQAMGQAGQLSAIAAVCIVLGWLGLRWYRRRTAARLLLAPRISVDELKVEMDAGKTPLIIDVRAEAISTHDPVHIPGALFIALRDLARHAGRLPQDRPIVVYCNCPGDASAARAAQWLTQHGRPRVRVLAGGLDAWTAAAASA